MKQSKETLKTYFKTGDQPTETQFSELIDSYIDAKQLGGNEDRRFVIDSEGEVSVTDKIVFPEYSLINIEDKKLSLLKDEQIISEVDLDVTVSDTIIKKNEATFTINDLNTNEVYEILPPLGENIFPILDKVVFDIDITKVYDEFATDALFSLELGSGLSLHSSPYINTNSLGRNMNINTVPSNITLSNENFNESIYLRPKFNAVNGALTIKVILFYSLVEF